MSPASPRSINREQALLLRCRAQGLARPAPGGPTGALLAVQTVCGVQAQELPAAALSIRARISGLSAGDVDDARLRERSLVRTWCLRGTLHLIPSGDLAWLVSLLGPAHAAGSRRRLAQMGLDEETVDRAVQVILKLLAERGPLTRVEIAEELRRRSGIQAEGQARIHLIYQAAMRGQVCEGPGRGTEPTYLRVEDWIDPGNALPREQALAELALRYVSGYGPSDPRGLAAWSGLSLGEARRGWGQIADRLVELELEGQRLWMLARRAGWLDDLDATPPVVRLLPRYDTYLLGYAGRELFLAPEFARRINAGGGIIHPAVLVNGRVVGRWSAARVRDGLAITPELFETPLPADPDAVRAGLQAEAADLGRFLGIRARLENLVFPTR